MNGGISEYSVTTVELYTTDLALKTVTNEDIDEAARMWNRKTPTATSALLRRTRGNSRGC
jgi:hypothetical protein